MNVNSAEGHTEYLHFPYSDLPPAKAVIMQWGGKGMELIEYRTCSPRVETIGTWQNGRWLKEYPYHGQVRACNMDVYEFSFIDSCGRYHRGPIQGTGGFVNCSGNLQDRTGAERGLRVIQVMRDQMIRRQSGMINFDASLGFFEPKRDCAAMYPDHDANEHGDPVAVPLLEVEVMCPVNPWMPHHRGERP